MSYTNARMGHQGSFVVGQLVLSIGGCYLKYNDSPTNFLVLMASGVSYSWTTLS